MAETQHWTAVNIPDLTDKIAVVTGGNSGIGFETAVELARNGAETIIACRSVSRGDAAVQRIRKSVPLANVEAMPLDLGDLASVDAFSERFADENDHLDILVNNAGIMATPYRKTKDGFESQFGTNHLGHFALTAKLMPLLLAAPTSRIVNVSSLAHRQGVVDLDALDFDGSNYSRWRAYGRSKLANLLFTYETQRRLDRGGVDHVASLASHPGFARTNLAQGLGIIGTILKPIGSLISQSAHMGALPTLRAAVDPSAKGGEYYGPDSPNERRGYPVLVSSSAGSHDEEVARRLWERSEELTGVKFKI